MYTLYKDEKGIAESTVAALFMTGFVVAGITASFVGSLADRHGRKAGCMTFCFTYSLSCLSVLSNDIFILFIGRALGGLSTTLLYSVFETWMIAEYHKRDVRSCLGLGSMFSLSVTLSGVVAILGGVIGETIVERTGTKTSPFMAAFVCLAAAFVGIHQLWSENYGEVTSKKKQAGEEIQLKLLDPRVLALGTTTTLFEGSMYLFVFFWSPAIISSRTLGDNNGPPPFGIIFSCFMCAMMLGSLVFSTVKPGTARDAAKLMLVTLSLASYALLIPALQRVEVVTFWSFALFEVCTGLYFPTMSRLKSEIVEDAVRARVYGLMRMPLNVFVVVALGFTKDGDAHRSRVFTVVGALLLSAFWVVHRYLT
jgi:MFS family permease